MHDPMENWEEELGHELERLPELNAPASLVPRVMRAVEKKASAPWWRRSWADWPDAAQTALLVASVLLLGGWVAALWIGWESNWASALATKAGLLWESAVWAGEVAVTLARAMSMVLKSAGLLFWAAFLSICGLMYLACVGLGTACFRLAKN